MSAIETALTELSANLRRIEQRHQAVGYKFDRLYDLIAEARKELATGGQALADKEMQLAMQEASSLAQSIFKRHYSDDERYASGSVVWGLCDSLRGVISQIDNMSTGLVRAPKAQVDARDAERYRWLRDISVPPHNFYLSVPDEFKDEKYSPVQVDAAIDAAIAAARGE